MVNYCVGSTKRLSQKKKNAEMKRKKKNGDKQ